MKETRYKSGAFRVPIVMYNHLYWSQVIYYLELADIQVFLIPNLKVEHSLCEHNCPLSLPEDILEVLENLPAW